MMMTYWNVYDEWEGAKKSAGNDLIGWFVMGYRSPRLPAPPGAASPAFLQAAATDDSKQKPCVSIKSPNLVLFYINEENNNQNVILTWNYVVYLQLLFTSDLIFFVFEPKRVKKVKNCFFELLGPIMGWICYHSYIFPWESCFALKVILVRPCYETFINVFCAHTGKKSKKTFEKWWKNDFFEHLGPISG